MGFWVRTFVTAFGLWLATQLVPGLYVTGPVALVVTAMIFGVVNALVRPVAVLLSLPLTILSLGLFLLVVNAAMLGLTGLFSPWFYVMGFGPAFWGAIVISIVGWLANRLFAATPRGA